jgi:hypothetical protein
LKVGALAMRAAASDDWLWARRGGGPAAAAGPDREDGLGATGTSASVPSSRSS